ncbi:MAG: hypothetical protein QXH07_07805 [Thermoplasmata archaeon]
MNRVTIVLISFLVLMFFVSTTSAQYGVKIISHNCYKASIVHNYQDGGIIEVDDGHMYEVDDFDKFDTQLWIPTEELLICKTTGSVNGIIVNIYTLRNLDESDSNDIDAKRLK